MLADAPLVESRRQAARFGLRGLGVDPDTGTERPLGQILRGALDRARPGLEAAGDLDTARRLLERLSLLGTGADRQRAVHAARGSLADAVDELDVAGGREHRRVETSYAPRK